jgi:hypothetical protein
VCVDSILPRLSSARNLERVIAALDHIQRWGGRQRRQQRLEFGRSAEAVAAALNNQHRAANIGEMRVATFGRPSRRMERIAEQHETSKRQRRVGGGNVRGDTSPHRFAADEQCVTGAGQASTNLGRHRRVARIQHGTPIRDATFLFGVREIKRDGVDAARGECLREADHEWTALPGTGSMTQNQ